MRIMLLTSSLIIFPTTAIAQQAPQSDQGTRPERVVKRGGMSWVSRTRQRCIISGYSKTEEKSWSQRTTRRTKRALTRFAAI